jgi:hypothetical protein
VDGSVALVLLLGLVLLLNLTIQRQGSHEGIVDHHDVAK